MLMGETIWTWRQIMIATTVVNLKFSYLQFQNKLWKYQLVNYEVKMYLQELGVRLNSAPKIIAIILWTIFKKKKKMESHKFLYWWYRGTN